MIDTDLEHVRLFARLKICTEEWEANDRHDRSLLRGAELASAE